MKQLIIFITFTFFIGFQIFAQEERGEGDIFMEENPDAVYSTTVTGTEKTTTIYSYSSTDVNQNYVVDYLFTSLSYEEAKIKALNERKAYFIDFTADWCAPCKMMDKTTFRDYNVVEYSKKNYIALQMDISNFDAIEMQAMYGIESLPTILFFDYMGNLTGRTTGLQTGTLFYKKLQEMNSYF